MPERWKDFLSGAAREETRARRAGDIVDRGSGTALTRYSELRSVGLQALAAGNIDLAVQQLSRATALRSGLAEAHANLALALEAAGRFEAARLALLVALNKDSASIEIRERLARLPLPPPSRKDFTKDHVIFSNTTGNRWTVLGYKVGGFGVVYKVRDQEDGTIHALKTFQARFLWSESDRNRFLREATVWARLSPHPNIVSAEWIEVIEDFPCVVQEFVEGGDLANLLATQALPLRRAVELAIQFCDGMQFAHDELGIIHRDIKSSNCLLSSAGKLKITDFGLARSFADSRASGLDLSALDPATRVQYTLPLGTLTYMAPEQLDPEAHLDTRTDIHAFGVLLYEMLTRDLGFYYPQDLDRGLDCGWFAYEYVTAAVKRFNGPKRLWQLVLACLEPDPLDRPQAFSEIRNQLDKWLKNESGRSITPPTLPLRVTSDYWNNKAVAFHALELYEDAIDCYDHALELNRSDPDLWQNKGATLICLKRHEEAIQALDAAIKLSPKVGDFWNNKGRAHQELHQLSEALDCFRKASHLSPRDPIICKNLAEVLFELRMFDEAIEWITKGLAADRRSVALIELKGVTFTAMGLVSEALAVFNEGLDIAPHRLGLWKSKGDVCFRLGYYREALDCFNRALELSPGDNGLAKAKEKILLALETYQRNPEHAVTIVDMPKSLGSDNHARLGSHSGKQALETPNGEDPAAED